MIEKINHIGIAVSSLEQEIPFYRDVLGLDFIGIQKVRDQKVRIAMFKVGEVHIELLEPTDPSSSIAGFLQKKGQGLHHIAFQTDDIEKEIEKVQSRDIAMIDQQPRSGAHGTRIAFMHPKSTGRVLTELCQSGGGDHE